MASVIRYTLRAAAVYDVDPAAVLSTLDTALHQAFSPDVGHFCSVILLGELGRGVQDDTALLTRSVPPAQPSSK